MFAYIGVIVGFSLPFARPMLLGAAAVLPLLLLLACMSWNRRRAALARFGSSEAIAQLSTLNRRRRTRSRICFFAAALLMIVAGAGPRRGKGDSSITDGRDLVIVLDLSKSMLTPDMSDADHAERWQAAQAGIRDLADQVRQKGGHRLGLVVFAAKPWPVCPLTADYDHFLTRLAEFSPLAPPIEVQPSEGETFLSGTRIGAAMKEGILLHDSRFAGYQDLLLLSDGDDPAPDRDQEIAGGIHAATQANIPVHVVGVGDPKNMVGIFLPGAMEEELVVSELQEAPLQEIARRTRGEYLSARRRTPMLGDFFRARIDSRPSRELSDDVLPQPREQYVWFLIPAIVLLVIGWRMEQ